MLTIYGVPLSVHTRKVILAVQMKQIPHEIEIVIPVMPDNPPPNWREISPTGLIPAIRDEEFVLADSTAIIHYLDRKQPHPALLPEDDHELGAALFLDAWAGGALFRGVIHPIFHNQVVNRRIRNVAADEAAIDTAVNLAAPEAFAYLESLSPRNFLIAGRQTIADLAVVSNLIVFHYLGHRIDAARFPKLHAYFLAQLSTPMLREALTEEVPYVDQMGLDRSFIQ